MYTLYTIYKYILLYIYKYVFILKLYLYIKYLYTNIYMKPLSLSICGFKYLWNTLGSSPQDGGVQWLLRHYCYKGMETWALLRKRETCMLDSRGKVE